ncbi:mitochondrial import inner membrane translocase subunit Tim9 isoform X1 [Pseudopipra pipra]|uniref:mitochondrial import inner membrane translocase subunit Tim9 isoform X1 n=1 Tax=Pseudopipra pipra TaxID=415032 RepID=UPI00313A149A
MAGQISESDQIKQFKEFLGTYNKLTENCFLDCIKDFTSRDVKPEEQRQNTDPSFPKECLHPEAGNTGNSCQPTGSRTIPAGRGKPEPCSRVPRTSAVPPEPSDQSAGRL